MNDQQLHRAGWFLFTSLCSLGAQISPAAAQDFTVDANGYSNYFRPDTGPVPASQAGADAIRAKAAELAANGFDVTPSDPSLSPLEYFQGGAIQFFRARSLAIIWSAQYGAHALYGEIGAKYFANQTSYSGFGFPLGDEQPGDPEDGCYELDVQRSQRFTNLTACWTPGRVILDGKLQPSAPPIPPPPPPPPPPEPAPSPQWGPHYATDRSGYPNYTTANNAQITASQDGANAIAAKAVLLRNQGLTVNPGAPSLVPIQYFQGGAIQFFNDATLAIIWSPMYGAHALLGEIGAAYFGGQSNYNSFGFPLTDELEGDPQDGCYAFDVQRSQRFSNITACWTPGQVVQDGKLQPSAPVPVLPSTPITPVFFARAHATTCLNTSGVGEQSISHKTCADGYGSTPELAKKYAEASLSQLVCVGSGPGCCQVEVNEDINTCGR